MHKSTSFIFLFLCLLGLTGCFGKTDNSTEPEKASYSLNLEQYTSYTVNCNANGITLSQHFPTKEQYDEHVFLNGYGLMRIHLEKENGDMVKFIGHKCTTTMHKDSE